MRDSVSLVGVESAHEFATVVPKPIEHFVGVDFPFTTALRKRKGHFPVFRQYPIPGFIRRLPSQATT